VKVIEVDGDEVKLDANHPLAGVDLIFDVEVVQKRPATEEELSHGHVHQADEGGCCGGGGGGGCGC
jgi:FKBP-type peptidyl-prolyl cis-trans isomerase SlyD